MNTGRRGAGLAAAVTLTVLVTGCGGGSGGSAPTSTAPKEITVHGSITLSGDEDVILRIGGDDAGTDEDVTAEDGYTCEGTGGFDDITAGSQVVISSDAGKTLAIGSLADEGVFTGSTYLGKCKIEWTVKGVPTTHKFYNIKIGHRDGPKWTLAKLKSGPELTLGSD